MAVGRGETERMEIKYIGQEHDFAMNAPSNFHWRNRQRAAKQRVTKTGAYAQPVQSKVREWNTVEAADNNRKTVEAINAYLRQVGAGVRV